MIKVEEMTAKNEFSVGHWLVNSDVFHPAWNQWIVSCVTLAGECDGAAPVKIDANNTHEIVVFALDPEKPVTFDHDGPWPHLRPIDHVIQIAAENDASARERVENAISMIEKGLLSPDSDFRSLWENVLKGKTFYKRGLE